MEVKIIISNGESATAAPGATVFAGGAPVTMQGFAPQASAAPNASGVGLATVMPPAETLRAAAALGAIDGGPAPAFAGMGEAGVPPAFITGAVAAMSPGSEMRGVVGAPDMAAGAAPGSGSQMETYMAPEPGGDE
jgi:hypothetical protein